jgi:ribonuclease-3
MDNRNNRALTERDVTCLMARYDVRHTCLDAKTYRRAMRHASLGTDTNERLEHLGDAVVALCVTDYCHQRYAEQDEAFLSRLKMQVVSGDTLSRLSVEVGLPSWLVLPARLEAARGKSNVQEDVMEAFVGAVYVEQGFDAAKAWFIGVMEAHLDLSEFIRKLHCSKDRLVRHCKAQWGVAPTVVIDDAGEDTIFNARVFLGDRLLGEAMATTRRMAEVDACLDAWQALTIREAAGAAP